MGAAGTETTSPETETHRDILEEVNWIVINVIGDEKIICHSQESHLRDGENVHKLLHLWTLWTERRFFIYLFDFLFD